MEGVYYYESITSDLKNVISNCEKCDATRYLKKDNLPERAIINIVSLFIFNFEYILKQII